MSKLNDARMASLSDKIYEEELEVNTKDEVKKRGSRRASDRTSTKKSNKRKYEKKKK